MTTRRLLPLLLTLLLVLPGAAAAADPALEEARAAGIELANRDRAANGLTPLRPDPVLNRAAQAHAEDMLARGYFAHRAPDGGTLRDRFAAAGGTTWSRLAENIATCDGCPDPLGARRLAQVQDGWMNSPGHRANILNPQLDLIGYGLAVAGRRSYAVQVFGAR
ncbi:CAP domain-containing protein [Zavarzinia sp. CC-PAN008]|uniref:CAP domain-containing protein n=1 Tax=Zavarzinia sp. CC-PAN008 TaxID=3243332 RepID=UPI003F74741B